MKSNQASIGYLLISLCILSFAAYISFGKDVRVVTTLGPAAQETSRTEQLLPVEPQMPARVTAPAQTIIQTVNMAPVGAITAWLKSDPDTPSLPKEWAECNGQVLSLAGSPYNGRALPNLNGVSGEKKRFLRGSNTSGATGGSESHNHGLFLTYRSDKRHVNVQAKPHANHLPPYYEITYIIKVL